MRERGRKGGKGRKRQREGERLRLREGKSVRERKPACMRERTEGILKLHLRCTVHMTFYFNRTKIQVFLVYIESTL